MISRETGSKVSQAHLRHPEKGSESCLWCVYNDVHIENPDDDDSPRCMVCKYLEVEFQESQRPHEWVCDYFQESGFASEFADAFRPQEPKKKSFIKKLLGL